MGANGGSGDGPETEQSVEEAMAAVSEPRDSVFSGEAGALLRRWKVEADALKAEAAAEAQRLKAEAARLMAEVERREAAALLDRRASDCRAQTKGVGLQ